ncbi:MAG: hypothetical protein FJ146_12945 [Deltaproteobacteria bacterium]|nr:hypothetical protein [Deltaproteobacteria bacterium]
MKLLKSLPRLSYLLVANVLITGACGHSASGAKLASMTKPTPQVELATDEMTIKTYPASTQVTYLDIDVLALNKADAGVKGELLVWIFPSHEPGHLVSYLKTPVALEAGQSKIVSPKLSLVKPLSVKNGEPTRYLVKAKLIIDEKEVTSFERDIEVKF